MRVSYEPFLEKGSSKMGINKKQIIEILLRSIKKLMKL